MAEVTFVHVYAEHLHVLSAAAKACNDKSDMFRQALSLLAFCLFVLSAGVQGFAQYSLTCASEDGRRHYCPADTRAGVTMQRQRSKSACTEGTTWGSDQNGVWVDRGCRADFLVNTPSSVGNRDHDRDRDHYGDRYREDWRRPEDAMQLTCSSEDGGRHYCDSDIQGKATMKIGRAHV